MIIFALLVMLNVASIEQSTNFVRLSVVEEHELQTIKCNYYRYGNKLKEIASRRATEIKMNTLPLDKKVDTYVNMINSNVKNIDDNFKEIASNYFNLPLSVQKELVKYYISDSDESSLSTVAREYVEKENKSPKIKQH